MLAEQCLRLPLVDLVSIVFAIFGLQGNKTGNLSGSPLGDE